MHIRSPQLLVLGLLVALCPAATLWADAPSLPRLTFIKAFEGSNPEYIRITLEESGQATYQGGSIDSPDEPEPLQLSPQFTSHAFSLVAQLQYFQGIQLDVERRVAYMGKKTFIYEDDSRRAEVSYNFTTNKAAEELRQLLENLARSRVLIAELQHRLVFDRLGLMESVRKLERQFNDGRLAEVEQFIPVLEKVVADSRLMELARTRARSLLRRFRGEPATLNLEYGDQQQNRYYKMVFVEGGAVTFEARRFDQASNPELLNLPPAAVERVWQLVRVADYFSNLADYQEPLGRLGGYRFTYESGPAHHQVAFSTPPGAAVSELVHVFRQVLRQEYYRDRLKAAVEEKSLMLQVILQEMEAAVARNELVNPEEFGPTLEGIAQSKAQHEIVRSQAQRLLARIRETEP
jgi:hypothetical protein